MRRGSTGVTDGVCLGRQNKEHFLEEYKISGTAKGWSMRPWSERRGHFSYRVGLEGWGKDWRNGGLEGIKDTARGWEFLLLLRSISPECWGDWKRPGSWTTLKSKSTSIFWCTSCVQSTGTFCIFPLCSRLLLLKCTWKRNKELDYFLFMFGHFCPGGHIESKTEPALRKSASLWTLLHYYFYSYKLRLKCHDTVARTLPMALHNMAITEVVSFPLCSQKVVRSWGRQQEKTIFNLFLKGAVGIKIFSFSLEV